MVPGSCGCECYVVLGLAVASGIKRAANQLQLRLRHRLGLQKRLYYSRLGWAYWQLDGLPSVNSASASIVASSASDCHCFGSGMADSPAPDDNVNECDGESEETSKTGHWHLP